jgi:hypothetical protein
MKEINILNNEMIFFQVEISNKLKKRRSLKLDIEINFLKPKGKSGTHNSRIGYMNEKNKRPTSKDL